MANLKSDSPTSRRIVRAFLDFLSSVEPAPGVDYEGLEVARECLEEVFKLDSFPNDEQTKPDSLVDIFSSLGMNELHDNKADLHHGSISADVPSSSLTQNCAEENLSEASKSLAEDLTSEPYTSGASKDELFGQFFAALEKIHFFRTMPDGTDDPVGVEKATRLFHDALTDMERSGCQEYTTKNLAETLKSQGNRAMQLKLYSEAIELYNCAIGLFENNAVYYCNRAAAYTQVHKYAEAVRDCFRSIEIDPNYSKAYSRLGLAYYAQGNYGDAIGKGFKKALQLDPSNEAVKENIRMAEQKLKEAQRAERDRSASSSSQSNSEHHNQSAGPRSHGAPPPFTSVPFNTTGLPADFANMFMNMATNAHQGQHSQNRQGDDGNVDGLDDPGIRIGGNINLNFGEQMPEELTGALRSVMEMFSGAAAHGNSHDTTSERSAPPN
ncbi:N-terminal acetyltransferase A, auxiliary subunit [Trema orientale]|uniref:N-terminal acetyltransferase A, auxiliary subunit n=1 Tax=Trema orientale TaxID=63057 RepID=A0A2P5FQR1_TREOI|nr:N-terminal acetyltransferase A, auxiliary subunit [Trema orientale]